jgi:hypothetical protein
MIEITQEERGTDAHKYRSEFLQGLSLRSLFLSAEHDPALSMGVQLEIKVKKVGDSGG